MAKRGEAVNVHASRGILRELSDVMTVSEEQTYLGDSLA